MRKIGSLRAGKMSGLPRVVKQCRAEAAGLIRGLAKRWHSESSKTLRSITFTHAHVLYEAYLATFPTAADRRILTYYLAEVLFKLERWSEAGAAYARAVQLDPKVEHTQTREAAYAAVISLKNAADKAGGKRGRARTRWNPGKPRPIPPPLRRLLTAFETYLKLVPAAQERAAILYRQARIYQKYDHHPRALATLRQILKDHADHELASYAASLLLDSLNLLGRHDELARRVDLMLAEPKLAKGQLLETLTRIKLSMARKRAEYLKKAGRHEDCGKRYLQLAAIQPQRRLRAELLYNAAICFDLARLHDRAMSTRKNLLASTPKAALVPRVLLQVASACAAQKKSPRSALSGAVRTAVPGSARGARRAQARLRPAHGAR